MKLISWALLLVIALNLFNAGLNFYLNQPIVASIWLLGAVLWAWNFILSLRPSQK